MSTPIHCILRMAVLLSLWTVTGCQATGSSGQVSFDCGVGEAGCSDGAQSPDTSSLTVDGGVGTTHDLGAADGGVGTTHDLGAADAAVTDSNPAEIGLPTGANDVLLRTRLGTIIIRTDPERAPITTENFLQYVDDGFFDGRDGQGQTLFHRVISGFMIQGGGLLSTGQRKTTRAPIINEAMNGLRNLRGTIAMARTNDPNSATSQFFINHADNSNLDYRPGNDGYAVFGEVIAGMDTVDAIASLPTGAQDVPLDPVVIEEAVRNRPGVAR